MNGRTENANKQTNKQKKKLNKQQQTFSAPWLCEALNLWEIL
jgi:hypothetical protein